MLKVGEMSGGHRVGERRDSFGCESVRVSGRVTPGLLITTKF